jgi:hypothetical protein
MLRRVMLASAILLLAGCQRSDVKVLIGGAVVTAPGAPPIEDGVIVVAGRKIRSVGARKDIPIPQDSERTDLTGKWVAADAGGRIAPGEPANLAVLDSPQHGAPVVRRMVDGEWRPAP